MISLETTTKFLPSIAVFGLSGSGRSKSSFCIFVEIVYEHDVGEYDGIWLEEGEFVGGMDGWPVVGSNVGMTLSEGGELKATVTVLVVASPRAIADTAITTNTKTSRILVRLCLLHGSIGSAQIAIVILSSTGYASAMPGIENSR